MIKKFNVSRRNIWRFKDVIGNFHKVEVKNTKIQQEPSPILNQRKKETVKRLEKKSSPYGITELKEISLKAYTSEYIRGFCERWKINKEVLEDINDNTIDVLEQLKNNSQGYKNGRIEDLWNICAKTGKTQTNYK